MFVRCGCIWKTYARFEGCLFTVHVYGRLVQDLRDVCSLCMYMEDLGKFEGCLFTVHVYGRLGKV